MTASLDYRRNLLATKQYIHQHDDISAHFAILSMWAVVGLAATGLTFMLGSGADVVQSLAAAG
jgi:hypothetical protein